MRVELSPKDVPVHPSTMKTSVSVERAASQVNKVLHKVWRDKVLHCFVDAGWESTPMIHG
jgi:hypothetical protein